MSGIDILIEDLNDISEILKENGYGGWNISIQKAIALLKKQRAELLQQEAELDILRNIYKKENPTKQAVKWDA